MAVNGLTQIRNNNILAIFNEIVHTDGILRSEISERTGISLMTVGKIMDMLLTRNIVYEQEYSAPHAGRKPAQAFLNAHEWWICVFSITDRVKFNLLNLDLKVTFSGESLPVGTDWELCFQDAISQVKDHIAAKRLDETHLIGVGVSAPAPYNAAKDRVACPKRPNLEKLKIGKLLQENFNTALMIDEDVKLAAVAALNTYPEYASQDLLYLYVGIGVGGVLLQKGEIYRGADNYAGDIGQFLFPDGTTVEDRLSWDTLRAQLAQFNIDIDSAELPPAGERDPKLNRVVEDYAYTMALAAYNAACFASPAAIVIDGRYHPLGKEFYDAVRSRFYKFYELYERHRPKLHFSFGGMDSAVLGLSEAIRKKWILQYQAPEKRKAAPRRASAR